MHARHRSPGNGYRSSSMGMGGVAASNRISPEGSARGHGMYGSDYRNYNRGGFGRGQPKQFQPPLPPPPRRGGDVFMEAGRLATEYLVSKGVLPPNVLSGKWQNGSLKNQVEDFQGFRPPEGDNLQLPAESRSSALARLGDTISDAGAGKRRFSDEFNTAGSRNFTRGRRRMGSFKGYGPELTREMGRSRSWSEKGKTYVDKEGDDDSCAASQEEQRAGKVSGNGEQNLRPTELPQKTDAAGNSESALENYQLPGSKVSSSSTGKDLPAEPDVKSTDSSTGKEIINAVVDDVKDDGSNDGTEKKSATVDIPIQQCAEEVDPVSKNSSDLLRDCKFAKVPTKTRSSLTTRGSKIDPVLITEDESTHGDGLPRESGTSIEDVSVEGSSGDALSHQSQSTVCLETESSKASIEEDVKELSLPYTVKQENCSRSLSVPERAFMNEQESSEGPPGFGGWSSMVIERSEKRAAEYSDNKEGIKKPREWDPSVDNQVGDFLHIPNSREKHHISEEGRISSNQKSSLDISLYPEGGAEQHIEYAEEKQLFPGSFKICDLNLMESSDVNENHDADPVLIFPSIPPSKKEAAPVDIGLSMNSNSDISDKYGRRGIDGKDVEVIDLESDSLQQDKAFNNSERKDETVFTGLESFPSHAQNVGDIPDVQDGYGLMISELLGNDMPNCASVAPDVNSLQNEMGIHNGEGILGDDDSIYMSLGEIPISFLRVWDQQSTQEYGKPF
ncbi:hypothetical protein LguiB_003278 [Lonicera macranthoides]